MYNILTIHVFWVILRNKKIYRLFSKKIGFTLSEILLVMTIIGIIAAETIPVLNNNIQESLYNVGAKKAYSILSQALATMQANDVNPSVGPDYTGSANVIRTQFCSVESCIQQDTTANIFGINSTIYKGYKGDYLTAPANWPIGIASPAVILSNGMFIMFNPSATCGQYGVNACGWLYIDINGNNGPNMCGKDLYMFWVVANNNAPYTILPAGTPGSSWGSCAPGFTVNSSGLGCTYRRLTTPDSMP